MDTINLFEDKRESLWNIAHQLIIKNGEGILYVY